MTALALVIDGKAVVKEQVHYAEEIKQLLIK
jgi:hypothetical protein